MDCELSARIEALDGKDAIHCLTLIANSAPPGALGAAEAQAKAAGLAVPPGVEDAELEGAAAGRAAKTFLARFAEVPGGAAIVQAALDQPQSRTADFGLISGAMVLTVVWLAVTGDIDIQIGGFKFRKPGLTSADQVSLGKELLPKAMELLH